MMTPTIFAGKTKEAMAMIQASIKEHEREKKLFTVSVVESNHNDVT